jgi:ATP/maltotriose-dependent transcriptional regulator MalT/DNA-binding SARP family transcriptional activator
VKRIANISKITPPLLPPVLNRSRLLALLEGNQDKNLILIIGQAAQGKTTLAASYAKASKIPTAWLNLGPEESDPFNLFPLLIHSLQQVLGHIDFSHLLSYPFATRGPKLEVSLFQEWMQSLFELLKSPIQIVMDGLENLSPSAPAFKFLQIFLENLPLHICLILLSREIPPLSIEFQRPKIGQKALVLTNEELAFTLDEIREFFKKIKRVAINAGQLMKISRATEGWIGGLILFSESLRIPAGNFRGKYIFKDLPDHFRKGVFQYFDKEIFSPQTKQVQEFLIKSSMVDLVEPGFMKDFIGGENAGDILKGMVRRNLFVHSVFDERKGWLFRYHQLFRDFLKAKFETDMGNRERQFLFLKAGELYEQRGEFENAVRHFLEGQAYPRAISVIERVGKDLLRQGKKEIVSPWISALPEETVRKNPWLLLYLAATKRFLGVKTNIIDLTQAFQIFKRKGNVQGQILSLAYLIENLIYRGHYSIPIGPLIKQGEKILSSLGTDLFPYDRGLLWIQMGLIDIWAEGGIQKGIHAAQTAYLIGRQLKDIDLQIHALISLVLGFAHLGEFLLAEEAYSKIEKIIEKSNFPEMQPLHLLASCVLFLSKGNLKAGEDHINRLENSVEKFGLVFMQPMVLGMKAFLNIHLQRLSEAEKIGKRLLDMTEAFGNRVMKGLSFELIGQCYYHLENYSKAQDFLEKAVAIFSSRAAHSVYALHRARLMMGLVCCHLKDYQRAEKELKKGLNYFNEVANYRLIAEAHFALAILSHFQGRADQAYRRLQAGLEVAKERHCEHFLILSPRDLMIACILALKLRPLGTIDHAEHLLCNRLASIAGEDLRNLSNHPDPMVRERVSGILRKIHRSKVLPLRVETLGGFRVFRGNTLLEEKEWDRNQPRHLMKAILSYKNHSIPKDVLMEHIWPETDQRSGENKLKVTLQRLRKSLEPVIDKDFDSSYIHLHDNSLSCDAELVQVDANLFLSLLKKGEEKEKLGDPKAALSLYTEAIELYKGDFLPDEQYDPWVDVKREELKGKYIDLLTRMAKLYEKQGASARAIACHKRAIQADPLLEESYQCLMTLYANIGMHNDALRAYEACKKALQAELESSPAPMTTALYKKILEKIHSS